MTKTNNTTTKETSRKTKRPTIPEFKTREAEAEFWDTHSVADYLHELKPVKVTFASDLSDGITVRFDTATLNRIRTEAKDKGLGATTLIRMWVMERLGTTGASPVSR